MAVPRNVPSVEETNEEIVHRYRDDRWSMERIEFTYGITRPKIIAMLGSANVDVRSRGRPRIPESEWVRRRKIAETLRSWEAYAKKLGIPVWKNPNLDIRHGVRLCCFFCRKVSVTTIKAPPGRGSKPVCAKHKNKAK